MTTRQALILIAGVVLVAVFLVIAVIIDPWCTRRLPDGQCYDTLAFDPRFLWYILAGVSGVAAVILAFTPWARRKD